MQGVSNSRKELIMNEQLIELGKTILSTAEEKLGKRQDYIYNGLWIHDDKTPVFNFDGIGYRILLTNRVLGNESEAIFQIAHEVVHLLFPANEGEMTYFEEGVATFFSLFYLESIGQYDYVNDLKNYTIKSALKYHQALKSVENIPNLFEKIKRIRFEEPELKLSKFKDEHYRKITDNEDLINFWKRKFPID